MAQFITPNNRLLIEFIVGYLLVKLSKWFILRISSTLFNLLINDKLKKIPLSLSAIYQ